LHLTNANAYNESYSIRITKQDDAKSRSYCVAVRSAKMREIGSYIQAGTRFTSPKGWKAELT